MYVVCLRLWQCRVFLYDACVVSTHLFNHFTFGARACDHMLDTKYKAYTARAGVLRRARARASFVCARARTLGCLNSTHQHWQHHNTLSEFIPSALSIGSVDKARGRFHRVVYAFSFCETAAKQHTKNSELRLVKHRSRLS